MELEALSSFLLKKRVFKKLLEVEAFLTFLYKKRVFQENISYKLSQVFGTSTKQVQVILSCKPLSYKEKRVPISGTLLPSVVPWGG